MKSKIQPIFSAMFSVGMVVLLMIAPCKVRNYIQSELGAIKTEVSSKSKSKITNYSCISISFKHSNKALHKNSTESNSNSLLQIEYLFKNSICKRVSHISHRDIINVSPRLPLYILYQNLLIYL